MTTVPVQRVRPHPSVLPQLLASSRPLSWVNTAYPFAAAYLLAGGGVDAVLVIGTLWLLVPYNLMMYGLNDVFDYESDVRNPRKGGVEGIVLDRRLHRLTMVTAALSNLPFVVVLVAAGDASSTTVLAVSVFAVVAYSAPVLRFKERPVLDSVTSSTHFVSPAALGLALSDHALSWPAGAAIAAFFAWGMASHAFGAVQDIRADREGGIASVATWLGARRTVGLVVAAYVVSAALLCTLPTPWWTSAVLVVPYLANAAAYLRLTDDTCERAHAGWRRFLWLNYLSGFLVTQLLILGTASWALDR